MTSTPTTSVTAAAAAITSVTLEVPDPDAAGAFYRSAFGLGSQLRLRVSQAPTTVYRLFSSKLGILKAMLDVSIGGDDEAVAMADRPQVRALFSAVDPQGQVAAFAALLRQVMARVGPVHRILADAARSDQDAASLLTEIARQRHEGQQGIARSLDRSGALRPGLKERDAADIIHALASPEVYGLLVTDRAWSRERYENWLKSILIDQLLPP